MPNYIYIQSFIEYNPSEFNSEIISFKKTLLELGFGEDYCCEHLENIRWIVSDNGFMYDGCSMPSKIVTLQNTEIDLRPIVMGYTPSGYEGLSKEYIEFAILIDEELVIENYATGKLREEMRMPLWEIAYILHKNFLDNGVFLTEEVTDKGPLELIDGITKCKSCFDLAIIPPSLNNIIDEKNENYLHSRTENYLYLANAMVWEVAPW